MPAMIAATAINRQKFCALTGPHSPSLPSTRGDRAAGIAKFSFNLISSRVMNETAATEFLAFVGQRRA